MLKRILIISTLAMMVFGAASVVYGQDVLMNSAETINKGNFKAAIFPTILLGKNGSESVFGVAGRLGFGLTDRFDIEAKGAYFEALTYFGVDVEYWLVRGQDLNASLALGGHMTSRDVGADSAGFDTSFILSTRPASRLELYGGLKLAFDSYKNSNTNFTLIHVVPGLEYKISADLDFLAEFGIALNDNSRSYVSAGFALYFLR